MNNNMTTSPRPELDPLDTAISTVLWEPGFDVTGGWWAHGDNLLDKTLIASAVQSEARLRSRADSHFAAGTVLERALYAAITERISVFWNTLGPMSLLDILSVLRGVLNADNSMNALNELEEFASAGLDQIVALVEAN